jgi:hypothetical protein
VFVDVNFVNRRTPGAGGSVHVEGVVLGVEAVRRDISRQKEEVYFVVAAAGPDEPLPEGTAAFELTG